jgi:DNA-directed RNA polymerase specialized sigma subunit
MMQALEQEMAALRRAIRQWLDKMRWRRNDANPITRDLAHDLGMPTDVVSQILEQTAAELRELGDVDDAGDPRPIIHKALNEIAKYGYHSRPFEEAAMERCLTELPERDLTILRHFKQGKKHREIAEMMGMDLESVRRSLIKTYSDLRMQLMSSNDDDGGDALEADEQRRARIVGPH